ncbi:MAG: hypothetical protein JW909_01620 [Planctomycetes bacterium]|nr:hypothetical protein [Planctomycetota bacterium]
MGAALQAVRGWTGKTLLCLAAMSFLHAALPGAEAAGTLKSGRIGLEDPDHGRMLLNSDGFSITGGAFVDAGGERLRADTLKYVRASDSIMAEGYVVLEGRGWFVLAEKATYSLDTRDAELKNVELFRSFDTEPGENGRIESGEVSVVVVRAETVRKQGDRFHADNASVTSCGFYSPHYLVSAEKLIITSGGILQVRNARLKWGPATLFKLADAEIDPARLPYYLRPRGSISNDADWGLTLEAGIGIPRKDGERDEEIRLNYRAERGPGFTYDIGPLSAPVREASRLRIAGVLESGITAGDDAQRSAEILARRGSQINGTPAFVPQGYYLYEQRRLADGAASPDLTPPTYQDDFRYLLDYRDHFSYFGNAYLDVSLYKASDRDFPFEYDETEWLKDWYHGSHVTFGGSSTYGMYRLHTAFRTGDEMTLTEYLPEARVRTFPLELGAGLYLNSEMRSGLLRRYFDPSVGYSDFWSYRTHGAATLERPFNLGGGFKITPYITARSTHYSESRTGKPLVQAGIEAGAACSALLTGEFPTKAGRLIHSVRTTLSYVRVPGTSADPLDVYDFDGVDDFMPGERLELCVDQRLSVRTGAERYDIARLTLSGSLLLDEAERLAVAQGGRYGPLRADLLVRPTRLSNVFAVAEGIPGMGLQDLHAGISFSRRLDAGADGLNGFALSYRLLAEDIDNGVLPTEELAASLGFNAGRWSVQAEFAYELQDNALVQEGTILSRMIFTRDFHDAALSIGASYNWADDEYSISLRLASKGFTSEAAALR